MFDQCTWCKGLLHANSVPTWIPPNPASPRISILTTFWTHKGPHRYVLLNYGTSAASEVFQHAISQALTGMEGVIIISDNILIFGTTQVAQDKALQMVFEQLRETSLALNKEKCGHNKSILEFFGLILEAIANAPRPTNISEVRSLLGMTNCCSKFIVNYASLGHPVNSRRKTHHSNGVSLTSAPVMAYFDSGKCTELT